jgi:hypothetical protein
VQQYELSQDNNNDKYDNMNNNDESKTRNPFDTDEEHETHDNFVNDNDRHRVVNTLATYV